MSDWIDDLQKKERSIQEQGEKQREIRLHNAKIIAAKAPTLWEAVINFIRRDCEKLRERFPETKRRHCHLDSRPPGVAIVNDGPLPKMELYVELSIEGQCAHILERVKVDRIQMASERDRTRIDITVDDAEELEFRYKGNVYTTPESLAKALVSYVCEIK